MNAANLPTQESFLRDVADHQMIVSRDDGVYRHITFKRPGSSSYRFDLVTWPGYLAYTGDMGTFVFCRLPDMFEFFRTNRGSDPDRLYINLGYWAQKLNATDRNGGHEEFDRDKFRQMIHSDRLDWVRGDMCRLAGKEERRELWEAAGRVMDCADLGEQESMQAASEFSHKICFGKKGCRTFEFYLDGSLTSPTYNFVWCCYALAWGIKQYDAEKGIATVGEQS